MDITRKGFFASLGGAVAGALVGCRDAPAAGGEARALLQQQQEGCGGQGCSVRAFGAAGDGARDDSRPINAALQATRKVGEYGTAAGKGEPVTIPPGIYRLDEPLNLTGTQHNLRGTGAYQTVLRANTGGVAADMARTGFTTLRDVLIDVLGARSPAVLGILQARDAAGAQAYHNNVYDTVVRLGHDARAHGGRGTVGLYNVGCENTTYHNLTLRADTGLYLGSGNRYGIRSPHAGAIGDNVSMTVVGVRGTSAIAGMAGPAVRIVGGGQIDLGDTSLYTQYAEAGLARPYPYAIEVLAQTTALRYTGSTEGYPALLKVHSLLTGLFLECYMAHAPGRHRVFLAEGAVLSGGRIDVVPTSGSSGGNLIEAQTGYASVVEGMDISLYGQGIDLKANGVLRGCTIRSTRTLAATKRSIVAGTRVGNVITASDGVHIDGVTPWS